ncbi:MAG TPA: 3-oxoadipate enol-lactonase [Terriglobales bacterium]|nr:3-oxoadipate enol-lactonase [Terriglobales bacterium]
MPFITANNTRLFYRLEGAPGKPVVVLSNSIGTDHAMWAPQAADLLPYFQVLRYDTRGHGASDAPEGEYSIELLARDVLGLTEALGIKKFAFCGLSLGGATGQWLAIHAPERLTALVLANTSAQFGPRSNWETRIKLVREGGMAAIVDVVMPRFFSPERLTGGDPHVSSIKSVFLGTNPSGYISCCAALRDVDFRESQGKISVATLVIAGDRDVATPWEGHAEILARDIPNAKALRLPAAHLANLERPRSFSAALLGFLSEPHPEDSLQAGFAARRATLGDAYVDRAMAATNDFNRDFQDLITRYAWGSVWTRPGLDPRTRRLLVLATMAALGRWEEFGMHVRAGLAHELEPCDLKELLLQTAIYAGVPAANTGFHVTQEIMQKLMKEKGSA